MNSDSYIFLSHSRKDEPALDRLCHGLESRGSTCWFAPRNIPLGQRWAGEIVRAIQSAGAFIVLMSKNVNNSAYVPLEVEIAFSEGVPIIPVQLGNDSICEEVSFFTRPFQWIDADPAFPDDQLRSVQEACKRAMARDQRTTIRSRVDRKRISIRYKHDDVEHNYCVVFGDSAVFGRSKELSDFRLYDVEATLKRQAESRASGDLQATRISGSSISRRQWSIQSTAAGFNVTSLSNSTRTRIGASDILEFGQSQPLRPNATVALGETIGLRFAGIARDFPMRTEIMRTDDPTSTRHRLPTLSTQNYQSNIGAARFERLYSLTGETTNAQNERYGHEAYVIANGWVTIGADNAGSIPLPPGTASSFAATIFESEGALRVARLKEKCPVALNGNLLSVGESFPLSTPSSLRVGVMELEILPFQQLHV